MARQPDRFLEIYLADHLAAAAAGLALVRRAARSNTGTRTGDTLRRLTFEIDEDRHTLRRLVTDLGFTGSKPKEVVAWAAEKMGRLKRNGQLRGYSPLSRVLELEALSVGIAGKAGALGDLGTGTRSWPASQGIRAAPLDRASSTAARRGGATSPRGYPSGIRRRDQWGKVGVIRAVGVAVLLGGGVAAVPSTTRPLTTSGVRRSSGSITSRRGRTTGARRRTRVARRSERYGVIPEAGWR